MELISREMAIDHIRVLGGEDRERLMGILNNKIILPTIESRPKGKWEHLGETIRAITLEMHQCSECGYVVLTRSEFNQESYCPHCGADMRG